MAPVEGGKSQTLSIWVQNQWIGTLATTKKGLFLKIDYVKLMSLWIGPF